MVEPITIVGEVLITLIQAYSTAAQKAGYTAEEAKAKFLGTYEQFFIESEKPVDKVQESEQ